MVFDSRSPPPLILDLEPIRPLARSPELEQVEPAESEPAQRSSEPAPTERSSWRRWLTRAVALVLVGAGLYMSSLEPLYTVVILMAIVVPFERFFPRHKGKKFTRPHLATDVSYALASPLLNAVGLVVGVLIAIVSLAWIPGLLIRPLVAMIPPILMPFVAFALFDLVVYWAHRWYHEVPFLWRFHAIHHSTEDLDWASGFRAHPLDGALIAPAAIFLLAAGFSPEVTGVITVIQILTGLFLHANVKWRLKPLHKLVITPEFHHWHHTNEPEAIWSNYSTFLPAWDLVFGTYYMPKDKRPQNYGVDEYIPEGMTEQLMHPLRGMGSPLWILRHPLKAVAAGFRFTKMMLGEMWRSATRPRGHTPFNEKGLKSQFASTVTSDLGDAQTKAVPTGLAGTGVFPTEQM